MGFETEFSKILAKKLGETPTEEPQKTPQPPSEYWVPPSFFIPTRTWTKRVHGPLAYPKTRSRPSQPSESPVKKEAVPIEQVILLKDLSPEALGLMAELRTLGAQLGDKSLLKSQLKREYRRLVKAYHPDHCREPFAAEKLNKTLTTYRKLIVLLKV